MKLMMLDDHVLVRRENPRDVSVGNIVIPEMFRGNSLIGEVVSVGPGKLLKTGERLTPSVKVGDRVFFGPMLGQNLDLDGVKHVLLVEDDIFGFVDAD